MTDIFEDVSKKRQHLYDHLPKSPIVEISGVVGMSGVGAGKMSGEELWTMTMKFDAWRVGEGPLRTEQLTVSRKVSDKELNRFQSLIEPEDIIKIHAHLSDKNTFDTPQALLIELIQVDLKDSELHDFLEELRKPFLYEDEALGTFSYDRQVNWYAGEVTWDGKPIKLNLSFNLHSELEAAVQTARVLWKDQIGWNQRICEYAVQELLPLKNECWLEEDEAEVTAEQFKNRMKLNAITVYPGGYFEYWHDDGDLFWGHSILVSGSISDGPTNASIPG